MNMVISTTIISNNQTNTGPEWIVPVSGKVIRVFGEEPDGFHQGVDINGNNGKTVIAVKSGFVIWASLGIPGSLYNGFGNVVCIDHGDSYKSIYGHLDTISVNKGSSITQGQAIGTVGNTGDVNIPQLHFEIRFHGSAIDPSTLLIQLTKNNNVIAGAASGSNTSSVKTITANTNKSPTVTTSASGTTS